MKWDPILLQISQQCPSFLMYLSEELVHRLAFDSANAGPQKPVGEALFLWLIHVLTSSTWASHRPYCPTSYIRSVCQETTNHWGKMLFETLQKQELANPATFQPSGGLSTCSSGTKPIGNDLSMLPDSGFEQLREHGWAPVEKWDSRPLGVASSN